MNLKKNNQIVLEKLYKCDILNRYCLTSIFYVPQLKEISFSLPLKDLLILRDKETLNIDSEEDTIKTKIFIILFFIFSNDPLIKNKMSIFNNEKKENTSNENLVFKVILCKKISIFNFLVSLFIESENTNITKNEIVRKDKNTKMDETKHFSFLVDKIPDFSILFNSAILSLNTNEYKFALNFIFKKNLKESMLKNFPFFHLISNKE